jgi:hypothetical protein
MGRGVQESVVNDLRPLILVLARIAVEDYQRPEAAPEAAPSEERPNPVPLPDLQRAA